MLTARECMMRDIANLFEHPNSEENQKKLKNIVRGYRVQIKPDAQNMSQMSARGQLIDSVMVLWDNPDSESRSRQLVGLMRIYRMQVKQNKSRKVAVDPIVAVQPVQGYQRQKRTKSNPTPVAGGPKRNQTKRGECPKCHSPGVVLAPGVSGEEFMACIYCGFQMFEKRKPGGGLEFDAASELFGRTFDENDRA